MLTPSQRKEVAEAVTGRECALEDGMIRPIGGFLCCLYWRPESDADHYKALVSKIAELIRPLSYLSDPDSHERHHRHSLAFIEALATNDTNALESLAYELLEAE